MLSTQAKIMRLEGLLGTLDINEREESFIETLQYHLARGTVGQLTEPQLNWLERLYERHFAG